MSLKIVDASGPSPSGDRSKSFAPGAPPSPGPLPEELLEELQRGEALVWWNEKTRINPYPPLVTLGISLVLMLGITMLAPAFWSQSLREIAGPLAAMLLPSLLMLVREIAGMGQWMVSDRRIIFCDIRQRIHRLPFSAVQLVRRDLWSGGVRLDGPNSSIRIAPQRMNDARQALKSQLQGRILGSGAPPPIDQLGGWYPIPRDSSPG